MSKTSSDPNKYFRTGIAIPLPRKAVLNQRLAELGLKTVGDLVTMFITTPNVVEALKPIAENFLDSKRVRKNMIPARREVIDHMKNLSSQELEALLQEVRAKALI